jgi:pyridoxine kinase
MLSTYVALIPATPLSGNHTGYRQFKGTKASAEEIREVYDGLRESHLTDFDILLSGYAPSAEAVEAVGIISRDLRYRSANKPGSFFWGKPLHLVELDQVC